MKKNKSIKLLVAIITLAMPQIVFATKYIVCDNDKKIPYVFASMVSTFITIIKIAVPILLVISGMISFFKVASASNVDDEMKKAKSKLINSIIAAVIIFFVFSIVNFAVSLVAGTNNKFMKCVECFINTDKCQTTEETTKLCPGLLDGEYDDECKPIKKEEPAQSNSASANNNTASANNNTTNSNNNTANNNTNEKSFDGFLFIGDSRYNGIANELKSLGSNIYVSAVDGKSAVDWLNNSSGNFYLPNNASNVSVMLGVNNLSDINSMKNLLNKLHSKYPNATIFINGVYHLGTAYRGAATNTQINEFNNSMVEFAAKNSWAKYISVTYGLDDPTGFVKNEYTYDGLHLNENGKPILVNNIKTEILKQL